MHDAEYDFIRTLVYDHSRIHLGDEKRELVSARLGKRLRATQIDSIGEYCEYLRSEASHEELFHLIDAISTNHTFFFRERAHFDFLSREALPLLEKRRREESWPSLNLWSAASSSGEEAYSIAMLLAEELGTPPRWSWKVEATDISHRVLERAAKAVYGGEAVGKLPLTYQRRYFQKGFGPQAGNFRVKPELQERVHFQRLNLFEPKYPFAEPFHLIFCRNVMIYFDRDTQQELVNRLTRRLVPGGWLLVGHSESLSRLQLGELKMINPAIYQRASAS